MEMVSEIEINNGKFYILENKSDEKNIQRFVYNSIKPAMDRLKDLIKTVNADKLLLSTVDITGKSWNITGVPWSIIAMSLVRGDVSKDVLEGIIENIEKTEKIPDTSQKKR